MSVHTNGTAKSLAARRMAFYDMDGTIVGINLLHATAFFLSYRAEWIGRVSGLAAMAARLPLLYVAERYDRHLLNVQMFALLDGISRDRLTVVGEEYCDRVLMRSLYRPALEVLEGNRAAGLEPVLVSGSPDFIVAPLARRLNIQRFAANELVYSRGYTTGRLREPVMAGEQKALWCQQLAERHGISLADSWGYADSYYDLPFLAALGHPVAVNPDRRLAATARIRQWPIVRFHNRSTATAAGGAT
jgi:alcohol-forming fatty acyl-CoA reductase